LAPLGCRRLLVYGCASVIESTFLGLPSAAVDDADADLAILGIPFGVPYPPGIHAAASTESPTAIRARAARLASFVGHHDFDTGQPMLDGQARIVDCGDVPGDPADAAGNATRAEVAVRALLARDVVPVILGGDDSIPIPILAAYEGLGPITILQVDAHLDFRDEVAGVRNGYGSPCAGRARWTTWARCSRWDCGAWAVPGRRRSPMRERAATTW
jgi:agmatinase